MYVPRNPRKTGLDRGRVTGIYMTRRHEALILAIGALYKRRPGCGRISNSRVVQLLVEKEARRLRIAEPEILAEP